MKIILIKLMCMMTLLFCTAASAEIKITFEQHSDPGLLIVRATHIPSAGDDDCMLADYPCYAPGLNTAWPASWFISPCNNCYGAAYDVVHTSYHLPAGSTTNFFAQSYLGGIGGTGIVMPGLAKSMSAGQWFCVGPSHKGSFKSKGVLRQCALVPNTVEPPQPSCTVSPASIQLNHGNISADSAPGHKASQTVRLSCTSTSTVRVKALNYVNGSASFVVRTLDNLSNKLTVDGTDGNTGKTYSVSASGVNVTLMSELFSGGKAIVAGAFSASAVMVFEVV